MEVNTYQKIKRHKSICFGSPLLAKLEQQGSDLTFWLKTVKNEQTIWNNGLKTLDIQATKDSDLWEIRNKWGEPYNCPSLLSRESSRLWQRMKALSQSQEVSLSWRNGVGTLRRSRWLESWGRVPERRDTESGHWRPTESSLPVIIWVPISS